MKQSTAARQAFEESGVALRVVPNAKKTAVVGMHGEAVKLKVASPALEGKANAALLAFVAQTVGKSGTAELVSGAKTRDKVVRFSGLSAVELRRKLLESVTARGLS